MVEAAKDFQNVPLWQKAHKFVLSVYNFSDYFPPKEVYGLTSQFRRAALSIPLCIVKSLREEGETERASLLQAARNFIEECRYYLILAKDLGYGDIRDLIPQLEEVGRMLEEYERRD